MAATIDIADNQDANAIADHRGAADFKGINDWATAFVPPSEVAQAEDIGQGKGEGEDLKDRNGIQGAVCVIA